MSDFLILIERRSNITSSHYALHNRR